jgi:hypothetical protein
MYVCMCVKTLHATSPQGIHDKTVSPQGIHKTILTGICLKQTYVPTGSSRSQNITEIKVI